MRYTPGVAPEALCLLWRDRVFTGVTLLAGGAGCPDPGGGDSEALCASIRHLVHALAPETLIFPGRVPTERRVTTAAEEAETNPLLRKNTHCAELLLRRCREKGLAEAPHPEGEIHV